MVPCALVKEMGDIPGNKLGAIVDEDLLSVAFLVIEMSWFVYYYNVAVAFLNMQQTYVH